MKSHREKKQLINVFLSNQPIQVSLNSSGLKQTHLRVVFEKVDAILSWTGSQRALGKLNQRYVICHSFVLLMTSLPASPRLFKIIFMGWKTWHARSVDHEDDPVTLYFAVTPHSWAILFCFFHAHSSWPFSLFPWAGSRVSFTVRPHHAKGDTNMETPARQLVVFAETSEVG